MTDSGGMTASVSRDLDPVLGTLSVASSPTGIPLTLAAETGSPPPPSTAIAGSAVAVSAPDGFDIGEDHYAFSSWSDGGEQAHDAVTPVGSGTITATFVKAGTVEAPGTCSSAPAGSAPTGAWTSGRIGTAGDIDWYKFTLSSSRRVRIVLGDLAVGARVELYRGCSTLVAGSDQGGTTPEELFRTLSSGSYAVKVIGKTKSSSSPYALSIRSLPGSVTVLSTRTLNSDGTLRLMGEVYNNTSSQRQVTVTARLYSAAGTLLATRSAVTLPSIIEPQGRAPYVISGSVPPGYAKAVFSISAPSTTKAVTRPSVSIGSSGLDSLDHWRVTGTLRNTSTRPLDTLRVGTILYNGRLNTLEVMRASVGTTKLAAGASTTFTATSVATDLAPAVVRVRGHGYRR